MVNSTVFDKFVENYCNCEKEVLLYNYTKEKEKIQKIKAKCTKEQSANKLLRALHINVNAIFGDWKQSR